MGATMSAFIPSYTKSPITSKIFSLELLSKASSPGPLLYNLFMITGLHSWLLHPCDPTKSGFIHLYSRYTHYGL